MPKDGCIVTKSTLVLVTIKKRLKVKPLTSRVSGVSIIIIISKTVHKAFAYIGPSITFRRHVHRGPGKGA